nr:hypothetical protein [Tanacetum cinerariifolium]
MSSLFADTHNVVAILEKLDASEGFKQIIDFLSGSYIHYALTVNPHIYISCIKQFWNTASIKHDAEGVVCLPNEEIFAGLAQMGYEKPSTKLTFYKAFFSSQWKFLIHTLLQSLSAKRTSWNEFSTAMASTVFANMRWVGKGFSGVETPLFEGMLAARQLEEECIADEQVQADAAVADAVQENVAEDVANDAIPSPPSHDIPSPSQEQSLPPQQLQSSPQAPPQGVEFPTHIQQILDVGASKRVESSDDMEDVFNQGRMIDDLDKDEGIELVKDVDITKTEGRHAAEQAEKQAEIYHLDLDHSSKVLSMQEDDSEVQEVVKVVTTAKLKTDVVTAVSQKAAKRRKLSEEAQEAEDLKKHLEVVDDEDDDVFIEATPLARKRRSGELIGIVKKRFSTSKPTNFSDEYLLLTLKTMFEKPDGQDAGWKSQRSVLGPRLAQAVRECTYPDFLKCQPLNFKGTEGVVGLTQWFEKIDSVFNISNCTSACQVKYAACILQGVALTWWNSYVKTVTLEFAQALPWKTLKKLMTDKYCPRGEIKKLVTDMWELKTKGTDVIGYSRRFQELALMCDRMFLEESDRVEKYIGGLPDTIHDGVKATRPKTMQGEIEFATELIDKKICTFTERHTENKRKQDDNNNQAQQQPLKKQGVAIAYTARPGERKEYAGTLPLCNKCKFHHNGQCTVKYVNYKRVCHLTQDCRSPAATNNYRNPTCYQCRNQGHYRSDCPKLKNQDHVNQARDYEEIDGGYVAFGGNPKGGKITGKGKFDGKADEEFFVKYSLTNKAFRVFNSRKRIVEENLHIMFSENTPNVVGSKLDWLFNIDALIRTMIYEPIAICTQSNGFAGLQVKQKNDGIFICQDKYVAKILKKFGFTEVKNASAPIETQKPLLNDEDGKEVDVHMYRSMIDSWMYITSSRPEIMFAVCACARYQVNPKFWTTDKAKSIIREAQIHAKAVYKELDDRLVRATTTASSLEAEHDNGKEVFVQEYFANKEVTDKVQKAVEEEVEDINTAKLIIDVAQVDVVQVNVVGEVNAASIATTNSAAITMTVDEVTLAQALMEIKSTKPKAIRIVLQEPRESRTTTTTISLKKSQEKGKAIMIEEPVKLKKKDQIMLDEEVALKLQVELQAKFDKEYRLTSEKAQQEEEANIALIET